MSLQTRRALALLVWIFAAASALAQTVTVSGHAKLINNAAPTSKTTVHYELIGCANGQAGIQGLTLFSDYSQDYTVSSVDGSYSGLIFPNVGSPASNGIECNGNFGTTAYNVTMYVNGRPNGLTQCYIVGPGNFNSDSAQPCVTSPAIVTPNAVVTNPQGTQTIVQPSPGAPLSVNYLAITGSCSGCSGVTAHTISGTVNGVNNVFTLPTTPPTGGLMFYFNGLMQSPGIDYTLSGSTITMTIAPPMNSVLYAIY